MTPDKVFTFGEPLVVLSPGQHERIVDAAHLIPRVAGSELNVAVALARLECSVQYGGAVGPDAFGQLILKALRAEGLDTKWIFRDPDHATGFFLKEWSGPTEEPGIQYFRQHAAGSVLPIAEWQAALTQAQWVHVSGITPMLSPQNHAQMVAAWSHIAGVKSLDVNIRYKLGPIGDWRTCLRPFVAAADVLIGSGEEFQALWECEAADVRRAAGMARQQVVIGTEGGHGAWLDRGQGIEQFPVFPARVVDPVGAGDGFAAGVIAGRLWGWPWEQAMALGMVVGACAVASLGDYQGYPSRDEALTWLKREWIAR